VQPEGKKASSSAVNEKTTEKNRFVLKGTQEGPKLHRMQSTGRDKIFHQGKREKNQKPAGGEIKKIQESNRHGSRFEARIKRMPRTRKP